MNIENICEAVHKAYCEERVRQGREPYWTGGDYSKLDEANKDYDRVTVQAVLNLSGYDALKASHDKLVESLEKFGDHKSDCNIWDNDVCNCGFSQALKEVGKL